MFHKYRHLTINYTAKNLYNPPSADRRSGSENVITNHLDWFIIRSFPEK